MGSKNAPASVPAEMKCSLLPLPSAPHRRASVARLALHASPDYSNARWRDESLAPRACVRRTEEHCSFKKATLKEYTFCVVLSYSAVAI